MARLGWPSPRHLPWSGDLVTNVNRVSPSYAPWLEVFDSSVGIEDCRDQGFSTVFDGYFWFKRYADRYEKVLYFVDWPITRFIPQARSSQKKWNKKGEGDLTEKVNACGELNATSVVLVILLSLFSYVVVSIAIMPLLTIAVKIFFMGSPFLKRIFLQVLTIYNDS